MKLLNEILSASKILNGHVLCLYSYIAIHTIFDSYLVRSAFFENFFWSAKKCYKMYYIPCFCPLLSNFFREKCPIMSYILSEKCPTFPYSLTDFRVGGLEEYINTRKKKIKV